MNPWTLRLVPVLVALASKYTPAGGDRLAPAFRDRLFGA
jgi:hypothetical protein